MERPLATRNPRLAEWPRRLLRVRRLDNLTRPVSFAYFPRRRGGGNQRPDKERRASCIHARSAAAESGGCVSSWPLPASRPAGSSPPAATCPSTRNTRKTACPATPSRATRTRKAFSAARACSSAATRRRRRGGAGRHHRRQQPALAGVPRYPLLHAALLGRSFRRRHHHRLVHARDEPRRALQGDGLHPGRQLRADGLSAAVFHQVNQGGSWTDAPVSATTATDLENAILTRARQMRIAGIQQ